MEKILDLTLALENYCDENDDNSILQKDAHRLLKDIRNNRHVLSEDELVEKSNICYASFMSLISEISNERFIFYSDGTVEFKSRYLKP